MIYILLQLFSLFLSLLFLGWVIFALASIVKGAPFINTKKEVVDAIVALAEPSAADTVIDLGSGDGRIVFAFSSQGIEAHGLEINLFLVLWSQFKAYLRHDSKATFYWGNLWQTNLSNYSIVTVYGIVQIMPDLEKKLISELSPGAKIVSNTFQFPHMNPVRTNGSVRLYEITQELKDSLVVRL